MEPQLYLLALGSNQRQARYGTPRAVLGAAIAALEEHGINVIARAPIIASRPIGPSQRLYANSAVLIETPLMPRALLALTQSLETRFGRRRMGQNWRARVLDIDLILWSGGLWQDKALSIPHPHMHERAFVLGPAAAIAPFWRDPITGLSLAQLAFRLRARSSVLRA